MDLHTLAYRSQWNRLTISKHTKKDRMEREKEKNSSSVLKSLLHIWFAINGENSEKREYILQHATFTSTILRVRLDIVYFAKIENFLLKIQ